MGKQKSSSAKELFYHKKSIINLAGIENVTIHTLFLAEYIIAGHIAMNESIRDEDMKRTTDIYINERIMPAETEPSTCQMIDL